VQKAARAENSQLYSISLAKYSIPKIAVAVKTVHFSQLFHHFLPAANTVCRKKKLHLFLIIFLNHFINV
jgi:hypothetical protein